MLSLKSQLSSRDLAWERALTSQMNVLYYRCRVARWTWWDTRLRVVAGLSASAAVVTFLRTNGDVGNVFASAFGILSAVGGIAGAALRIPEKVTALGVLLAEYTAHMNTFERLYQFGGSDEELQSALKSFGETEQREAKDHPEPDEKLLEKSQSLVLARIGASAT